ncbi:hypothetical protein HDV00_000068 [Rhizophlyctis rosea]|nr:hypothetical protein HDV00_000068 [Rhizophlyctis rosea]
MTAATAIPTPPEDAITKLGDQTVVNTPVRPEPVSRTSFASTAASTATRKSTLFRSSSFKSNKSSKSDANLFEGLPRDPAEVLIDRCRGWLELFDGLLHHFSDVAKLSHSMASTYHKSAKHWSTPNNHIAAAFPNEKTPVPLLLRNFGVFSQAEADHHEAIVRTTNSCIGAIKGLKKDVQQKMEELGNELKLRHKAMKKDAEKLKALESRLVYALEAAKIPGKDVKKAGDPFLANAAIRLHLYTSLAKFTAHTSTISSIQSTFIIFETNLTGALKSAILSYANLLPPNDPAANGLRESVGALNPDQEWEFFEEIKLAPTQSPQAFIDAAGYQGVHDDLVVAVKKGELKRKSKVLKRWKSGWAVLTAAGWLHLFDEEPKWVDSFDKVDKDLDWPRKSIWLKECSLAPFGKGSNEGDINLHKAAQGGAFSKSKVYKFKGADANQWNERIEPFVKTIYREYNYQGRWTATGGTTSSGTTATTASPKLKRAETVATVMSELGPDDSISQVGEKER